MRETGGIGGASTPLVQTLLEKTGKTAESGAVAASPQARGSAGSVQTSADSATLSTSSSMLSKAMLADDVRTEKVAALKSAIESGTYQVPATAVAGKLMDSMLK